MANRAEFEFLTWPDLKRNINDFIVAELKDKKLFSCDPKDPHYEYKKLEAIHNLREPRRGQVLMLRRALAECKKMDIAKKSYPHQLSLDERAVFLTGTLLAIKQEIRLEYGKRWLRSNPDNSFFYRKMNAVIGINEENPLNTAQEQELILSAHKIGKLLGIYLRIDIEKYNPSASNANPQKLKPLSNDNLKNRVRRLQCIEIENPLHYFDQAGKERYRRYTNSLHAYSFFKANVAPEIETLAKEDLKPLNPIKLRK